MRHVLVYVWHIKRIITPITRLTRTYGRYITSIVDGVTNQLLTGGAPHCMRYWLVVWNKDFFEFPYIWNFIISTDFHIFQRGRYRTNQNPCSIYFRMITHIFIYIYIYIYNIRIHILYHIAWDMFYILLPYLWHFPNPFSRSSSTTAPGRVER